MNRSIVEIPSKESAGELTDAWEEFIETGEITHASPRSVITESWLNCRELGIDPHSERAQSVISADELELRLNKDDLGRAGKEVLDKISHMAEGTEHIIVLANANGQIIYSVGHEDIQSELERINFMPGGDWSTENVGPNGVGTPIALDRPELIFGSEHYCQAWKPWVCYGSPIHDQSGKVLGGIDITGPANALKAETLSLAISIAHSVESGLSVLSLQRREALRSLYRKRKMSCRSDYTLLVDEFGYVQDADAHIAKVFSWNAEKMWNRSLSSLNHNLWQLVDKCMQQQQAAEYEYHTQNAYHGVIVTIEPLKKYDQSLGAMVIVNPAIKSCVEPVPTQPTEEEVPVLAEDLKSHSDQIIRETLEKTNGNISKAARILGINRTTIYRRLNLMNQ